MTPYSEGYYAGLINDRDNPHSLFSPAYVAWFAGNQMGLTVHCALVEALYLNSLEHEQ